MNKIIYCGVMGGSSKFILCRGRRGQMGSSEGSTLSAISFTAPKMSCVFEKSMEKGDSPAGIAT